MKLYNLLFEAHPSDYTTEQYALAVNGAEEEFTLIDIKLLQKYLQSKYSDIKSTDYIAAHAATEAVHSNESCSEAVEINYMVANPKYPAAGAAMYAIVSNHFNKPITSDRNAFSSIHAKKAWARIENDPTNWTKVELDNYIENKQNRKLEPDDEIDSFDQYTYFDINGSFPKRSIKQLDDPKTPQTTDDCKLPANSTSEINRKLGTANAWLYTGPINAQHLINNFNQFLKQLPIDINQQDLIETIFLQGTTLFGQRILGPNE